MKKRYGIKTILASLLVTASLATPMVVMSEPALPDIDGEILFEGASLQYKMVGDELTIQAIFNVAVDKVVNGTGASFQLDYNPDYLTPSDMTTNAKLHSDNNANLETDAFFAADPDLFRDADGNSVMPFDVHPIENGGENYYSTVDFVDHTIHMQLHLAQRSDGVIAQTIAKKQTPDGKYGKVEILESAMKNGREEPGYVVNVWELPTWDDCEENGGDIYVEEEYPKENVEKVVLGQLSFQVNIDRLPEIVKYFGDMTIKDGTDNRGYRDYRDGSKKEPIVAVKGLTGGATTKNTYLLDISQKVPINKDPWQVLAYTGPYVEDHHHPHAGSIEDGHYAPGQNDQRKNVVERYDFSFPKDAIIKVEATNPELTINSYQNFTDGEPDDLAISMGKYSPMVTVTYADGSKENVPFPWGEAADGYTPTHTAGGAAVTTGNYDAKGGDYTFSQYYKYIDSNGDPQTFPDPVTAHMIVTPITVIAVTAQDLERTYDLQQVAAQVTDVDDLDLPTLANVVTDIVPAGVSITMPIKGWMPADSTTTGSVWPNPATNLHALKADNAVDGVPYWPDGTDLTPVAADHVGTYSFETSDEGHANAQGILSKDIRDAYEWLTVPEQHTDTSTKDDDWWDIDRAKRHIVAHEDYVDAKKYEVTYKETITDSNGQPTLTLSVKRTDKDISETAVFRTWLPNGQEIGIGQNKGGVNIPDWFHNVEGGNTVTHGFYDPGTRQSDGGSGYLYELDYNPDDPDPDPAAGDPRHDRDRETLRRYINLGGWYQVSICEDPDGIDPNTPDGWTEQIPVYVEPRRNEYIENKTYNFIGENAALFNWPGGVGDTLYLPRGSYTPVGPMYTANGVGLPLYDKNGTVTDGLTDSADVFDDGNPMRPKAGVARYEESYGAKTIYDGQTGAQPGEIFSVKVNKADTTHTADWTNPTSSESLHSFVGSDTVYKYGPTPLYHGYPVMAFGVIYQPAADLTAYKATLRTQLPEKEPSLREHIRLLSDEPEGITRGAYGDAERVTLATYDTVLEGYTVRKDYTFILENDGDVDIYGLDIDGLTDQYVKDPKGGRFEMLQPPASFLPVGARTTFTLTYVYNLQNNKEYAAQNHGEGLPTYRDTLYVTSTSHPNAVHNGTHQDNKNADGSYDYLLDFDAEFDVSADPLHKVTVICKPGGDTMGTAGLIVGEQSDGTDTVMNYTGTTQTFPKDKVVYVVADKFDEYEIKAVTITDNAGNTIVVDGNTLKIDNYADPALGKDASLVRDRSEIYFFTMPDEDVTVTINFFEPLYSKLRLSRLIEYSAPTEAADDVMTPGIGNDLKTSLTAPPPDPQHTYPVWRKTFSDKEKADAAAWQNDPALGNGANQDLYLMTKGAVRPHAAGYPAGGWPVGNVPADEGQQFLSSENQYIVVIDEAFDLSQVEATLRKVVFHEDYQGKDTAAGSPHANGYNDDIPVTVQMDVYPYGVEDNWNQTDYQATMVYTPAGASSTIGYGDRPGQTAGPTTHITRVFAEKDAVAPKAISPKPGESTYVRITLSTPDTEAGTGTTLSRYYYLEIHRPTKEPQVELHYGNSPYGMIWNESKWTDSAKVAAEEAFVAAGYTFRGATAAVTPDKATLHKLDAVTYWREAWVRNRGLYEPESFTGQHRVNHYQENPDGSQVLDENGKPILVSYEMADDPAVYNAANNLDLNRYAFFALLGEKMREPGVKRAWDSSGRTVDVNTISAEAEVTLLDATATKQVARFSGTDKALLDLGTANGKRILADGYAPGATIDGDAWPVSSSTTSTTPPGGGEAVTTTTYSLVENIRPGRYVIQYTYTDFDGINKLHYYRPFVILRAVGDVNTDGVRSNGYTTVGSDEYAIEDRVTDPLGYEAGEWDKVAEKELVYPYANIFKYRVCDVNNDRNINNIDANLVDKNVRGVGAGWLRFYEPVDYGLPDPATMP